VDKCTKTPKMNYKSSH